ncbi:MAG: AarF/UbiB family protein [Planctomycetota bacterium]
MLRSIRTIRNIPRLKDISLILVRHGSHQVAGYLGAPFRIRLLSWIPFLGKSPGVSQAERLRLAFQELGPIFIKLGQLIANRPDLFPEDYVEEFVKLEDRVEAVPFDDIRLQIETELGGPLSRFFSHVEEEPLAAASLAQVHRATTRDGADVILKVQKPGLQKIIESDLEILALVAEAIGHMEGLTDFDPEGLVAEVSRTVERELNFSFERHAIERVAANFKDDPVLRVPTVYPKLSTRRLLVQERFKGESLRRLDVSQFSREERHHVARECSRILFEMVFRDGYFHADPHASNIMLLEDGSIGFIDFGSVGVFGEDMRHRLVKLMRALIKQDYKQVAREVLRIGRPQSGELHLFQFTQDLASRLDPYFGLSLGETDIPELFNTVMSIAREHRIQILSGFVTMTRCMVLMEGVTCRIAPDFDTVTEMEPLVRQHLLDHYRPDRLAQNVVDEGIEAVKTVWEYPQLIGDILRKASEGRLEIDTELKGLDRLQRNFDSASNRIVLALVVSSILVSSSLIIANQIGPLIFENTDGGGISILGLVGYIFAGLIGARIILASFRRP